jgi:hypothetical protein
MGWLKMVSAECDKVEVATVRISWHLNSIVTLFLGLHTSYKGGNKGMKKLTASVGITTLITIMQAVAWAADKKAASTGDVAAVGGGLVILALPILALYLIPTIIGFIRKKTIKWLF